MAELLYRIGKFSARRGWQVIVAWLLVLGIAIGGFLIGFRGLASSFDVPNTASGKVVDELTETRASERSLRARVTDAQRAVREAERTLRDARD